MYEVTVKLQGGLGNYMFQIAAAHAYGLRNGQKSVFSTNDSVVIHKHLSAYKDNILSNVNFVPSKTFDKSITINEQAFNYNELTPIIGNIVLDGYFQTEKYFSDYSKEIRELFSYPEAYSKSIEEKYKDLLSQNLCSIHVRRGDYLTKQDFHPTQNMNYYMKAIKKMPKDSLFLVFSDDITWCKANFPDLPEKFKFIEGNSDFEDLFLMSKCKNNIICNSSFSWWAAWLNENPNKIVVAPDKWFGPAYAGHDTKDLYCENWIRI